MTQDIQTLLNEQHTIILDREGKLKATDYIAAKIAEGKATKKQYESEIELRQSWRDDINAAQTEIDRLNALTAEEPEPNENENENLPSQEQE